MVVGPGFLTFKQALDPLQRDDLGSVDTELRAALYGSPSRTRCAASI